MRALHRPHRGASASDGVGHSGPGALVHAGHHRHFLRPGHPGDDPAGMLPHLIAARFRCCSALWICGVRIGVQTIGVCRFVQLKDINWMYACRLWSGWHGTSQSSLQSPAQCVRWLQRCVRCAPSLSRPSMTMMTSSRHLDLQLRFVTSMCFEKQLLTWHKPSCNTWRADFGKSSTGLSTSTND